MLLRDILTVTRNTDIDICQYRDGALQVIESMPKGVSIAEYMQILDFYGDDEVLYLYTTLGTLDIVI